MLRSALDFAAVTHQLDTLIVTSAVSGEGKTTVAVDLAQAVALAGQRRVLAEHTWDRRVEKILEQVLG